MVATQADIDNIWYGIQKGDSHGIAGINYGTNMPYLDTLVKSFYSTFNRLPTAGEVAQVAPAFEASGTAGNAYLAQLYQTQNPNEAAKKGAADQYGTIDQLFKNGLGRAATQEEKDHFGTLLASKQYDAYDIQNMLSQLPESVRKQDEEFRKGLDTQLQASDSRYFNEQVLPGIQSTYAKQGRSFDSTGYQNALAQAAQGQNKERETFLSNLSANQYSGLSDRAYKDYVNNRDYTQNKYDTMNMNNYNRLNQYSDYNLQKQAYDQYLQRYGKRSSAGSIGGLVGGAIGTGVGAYFGGPAGAQAGYGLGSGFGGAAGSAWG